MDFNPRSRTGSDAYGRPLQAGSKISIHAPARGATLKSLTLYTSSQQFQSTLPHGERPGKHKTNAGEIYNFNPRSRTGSDRRRLTRFMTQGYFNPRSRTGSDVPKMD